MKNMKKAIIVLASVSLMMTGCGQGEANKETNVDSTTVAAENEASIEGVKIEFSDEAILVDGEAIST